LDEEGPVVVSSGGQKLTEEGRIIMTPRIPKDVIVNMYYM